MVNLIAGILIIIGISLIDFLIKKYTEKQTLNRLENENEDAFCDIDMNHVLMFTEESKGKDLSQLKRKFQDFKNRNRFYKM